VLNCVPGRRVATALAAGLTVAAALSGCDSAAPVDSNPRQVTVVGSGEVQGAPDTVTADVAIEVVAPDVTAAMNQTNERQRAVIDALTSDGIDSKDINTTGVSLAPQYGEDQAITGYRASNAIAVRIRQLDAASGALAKIIEVGGNATRINSVSYSIDDDSTLVRDARARAFNDAKDRADQYAQLSGLSLGKVISISEVPGGGPPPPMPAPSRAMADSVPLAPGEQTVSFSVTAVWELT